MMIVFDTVVLGSLACACTDDSKRADIKLSLVGMTVSSLNTNTSLGVGTSGYLG
jgi:hypothetical protein